MRRTTLLSSSLVALCLFALPAPAAAAPAPKFDLCHHTGNGSYQPISISANATRAHLAHGDVLQPNGVVPGENGYVFDSQCQVVSWDYAVNVELDESAQNASGHLLVGSGIPATNFGTATNAGAGIELGMGVIYRQGPTVASIDNYGDGMLEFDVESGPQSMANGSGSNNSNRAAWSFNFSVATGLNGATTNLSDYTFQLLYDVDPGPTTTFRTLTLEAGGIGQSGYQWRDGSSGLVFIADDGGTANVTQNSENYAFSFFQAFLASPYGPVNEFAGPAQFDIVLQALDGTQLIARNHIVVNVAAPPAP